ncbi:NADP-dependent malic enzyme [Ixodes scapularis]|uniref:NADP-dependent malic enzyme n=1 Tax=Ixodes scapularis TaxID=6945 RepID=UPI001C38DA68|nr:NADP-dependent malic enzyme [Ixodes scapularis]
MWLQLLRAGALGPILRINGVAGGGGASVLLGCPKFARRMDYLRDPRVCKNLSFSQKDRDTMSVRGLIPPAVRSVDVEIQAVLDNVKLYESGLAKYLYLRELHDYNEKLFFRVLKEYTEELMPLVYTPVVGEACIKYSLIFRRPKGLFLTIQDAGRLYEIMGNWPDKEVDAIVVTDGERILGLGDLGANGMGIPVGKLALYTALAGIHPERTLPVMLDLGTNNEILLADPYYIGLRQKRVRGAQYDDFVDEFMQAAAKRFGKNCLIQFEDFGNRNAFKLLDKYKNSYCTFNDDIQGTASVAVAGLLASMKITKTSLASNKILFMGAGEASLGIAELLVMAMVKEGATQEEARNRIWMLDSRGLIVKGREPNGDSTQSHKEKFAKDAKHMNNLLEIVKFVKPTVLIGASAQSNAFNKEILECMCENAERPVVFALSNPTHKAECTAEHAYTYTDGKCVFASGSPFPAFRYKGKTFHPGQGNNAYIFPGIALAVSACGVTTISDEVFLIAAKTVADCVTEGNLEEGRVYPPLASIHEVSLNIAVELASYFYSTGVATVKPEPKDKMTYLKSKQYDFSYPGTIKVK